MKIPFTKYQGTGNDFVMIDQRTTCFIAHDNVKLIQKICDRKFGIGADGLILLESHPEHDYEMIYFNADGKTSSMCGNGGRCITAFAKQVGAVSEHSSFLAIDGLHLSKYNEDDTVSLKMGEVKDVIKGDGFYILDTGSPHYVIFVEDIDDIDIKSQGEAIRFSDEFKEQGINVNFVEIQKDKILVATYERGVEDETLSCGTGVTAAAIAYYHYTNKQTGNITVNIETKGGSLSVSFHTDTGDLFDQIWLNGRATKVFSGDYLGM